MNKLYFGDNLDLMKRLYHDEHQAEFIDLNNDYSGKIETESRSLPEQWMDLKKHNNFGVLSSYAQAATVQREVKP